MEKELNIDWANLSFGYIPTDYNVRCTYKNGEWGEIEVSSSELIPMHMAASCLHYGQEAFEGLKAFRGKDGQVRVFRMDENAKRIQRSAEGIMMPALPVEKFMEMVKMVVRLNARFIPPYGSGASLYIRPLEIGMSAQVGVKPATEYLFVIFVSPVGPYFKGGFKTTPYVITRKYDRHRHIQGGRKLCSKSACKLRGSLCRIFGRVLSRRTREEIYGRVWRCQLLRNQGQHIHHSAVYVNPSVNHQQEPYAARRGYGHQGGTPSNPGR